MVQPNIKNIGISPVIGISLIVGCTIMLVGLSSIMIFDKSNTDISNPNYANFDVTIYDEEPIGEIIEIKVHDFNNIQRLVAENVGGYTELSEDNSVKLRTYGEDVNLKGSIYGKGYNNLNEVYEFNTSYDLDGDLHVFGEGNYEDVKYYNSIKELEDNVDNHDTIVLQDNIYTEDLVIDNNHVKVFSEGATFKGEDTELVVDSNHVEVRGFEYIEDSSEKIEANHVLTISEDFNNVVDDGQHILMIEDSEPLFVEVPEDWNPS